MSRRGGSKRFGLSIAMIAMVVVGLSRLGTTPVSAAVGDVGWNGGSYVGSAADPTGSKPESKLWWNDGFWWASMYDSTTDGFTIHRLDLANKVWVDTGVALDPRDTSRADALWDGTKLYVASHVYSTSPAAGYPSRLYRYSYDAGSDTYSLDPGFPVAINDYRTETLVIDKDSTGKLWATWTQGSKVWVNRTTGSDSNWGTPFVPAVNGTSVASDDISSVVSFGPNRIGVMWSNQSQDAMYFAVHNDGDSDTSWLASKQAVAGAGQADDHINLKSLQSDGSGRVFAAVKTSLTASNAPSLVLMVRDPLSGDWSSNVFARVSDNMTRPVVILDEGRGQLQMFATAPEGNGTIYRKTTSLANPSFGTGLGEVFLRDAASPHLNNVTSTKQNVNGTTGLVMLAGNETLSRYWWNYDPLGGGPGPTPTPTPTASPSASPTPTPTATPSGGTQSTFTSVADAHIRSTQPTKNYGTDAQLRVRDGGGTSDSYRPYLKFSVTGVTGAISSVRLRLYVTGATPDGGSVYPVGTGWTETGITWNNAPPLPGGALAAIGKTTLNSWVDVELGAGAVTGNGDVAFAIRNLTTSSGYFSSRQGAQPPQLIVTQSGAPTATPTATATATPTATATATPTATATATPTATPTATATATPTATPTGGTTLTVMSTADSHVKSNSANTNYGTDTTLRVRAGTVDNPTTYRTYLKFAVSGVSGPVTSVKLRLFVTTGTNDEGAVYPVASTWTESGLTWNNAPALPGSPLASIGATTTGTWVEVELGPSAVSGDGTYSFAIANTSTTSGFVSSREGTQPPQLVVTVGG